MKNKNLKITVGENIRMLRLYRGLSGVELARLLKIDSQHLSKWEAGDSIPNVEYIEKLSKILGKHRSFFFAG
jgi:transcriptional regulator with XRE-family HTH domain